MNKLLCLIFVFVLCFDAQAQFVTTEEDKYFNEQLGLHDSTIRSVNVPMMYPRVAQDYPKEDCFGQVSWIRKKIFREHFAGISDNQKYAILIDPVLDLRIGKEDGNTLYKNTRGYILNGQIGKNLFVRSEFYETQTTLSDYAAAWVDTMKFIPGMIRMKPFGINGFDYGVVFSQIMWQPFKNYGVRLGY
ncbi:MAG TPA: hypothetical protein PLZ67_03480, partial [Bacteroidales bacterium]|nr:hypothetical protein [Bacteroidales bacterium]